MNMPTIPKIKKAVAEGFEVSIDDIDSRVRKQPIALARQCVYYYARKLLGMKYIDLERKFDRPYSNMIHAVKAVEDARVYDVEVKAMLDGLESEFPWLRGEEVEVEA